MKRFIRFMIICMVLSGVSIAAYASPMSLDGYETEGLTDDEPIAASEPAPTPPPAPTPTDEPSPAADTMTAQEPTDAPKSLANDEEMIETSSPVTTNQANGEPAPGPSAAANDEQSLHQESRDAGAHVFLFAAGAIALLAGAASAIILKRRK